MIKLIEVSYEIKESKGIIKCDKVEGVEAALNAIKRHRLFLEEYISRRSDFKEALTPIDVEANAPLVVQRMAEESKKAGVGPMAAVAGVLADLALEAAVNAGSKIVLIENGGEIALLGDYTFKVKINAGSSPLSGKIGLKITPCNKPIGIATSSGTYGHALSFGIADAVTAIADTAGLADAAATSICNAVKGGNPRKAVKKGLMRAREIEGLRGAIIILGDLIGIWGEVPQIVSISEP